MKAKELYDLVLVTYPQAGEFMVCDLHKPCKASRQCGSMATKHLIDFDTVECEYDRGKPSRSSVDAIAVAGNTFCFIELKGWVEYLKHNIPTTDGIKKKANYNLKDKLAVSEGICVDLSGQENLFNDIPEVFILVTDIDAQNGGIENFRSNLMALSQTSSSWISVCNQALDTELKRQISISKYYTDCRHLDGMLERISVFD